METLFRFLLIFAGAGLGGVARQSVGLLAMRWFGPGFPVGTIAVNILGSAAMGLLVGALAARNIVGAELRLFWMTGVLGGFTTFSTFSLDSVGLWQRGEALAAAGYVAVSLLLSLAALAAGMAAARHFG